MVKRYTLTALAALLGLLFVLSVAGCTSTPRADYAASQDVFITVVERLVQARKDGLIADPVWDHEILPAIEAGDRALTEIAFLTHDGLPIDGPVSTLQAVLDILRPYIIALDKE